MTSLPSMPLYVDDYEAATAHLTLEEDGVYNRLLRLCWRSPGCSIPDDERWLRRHLRVSEQQYQDIVLIIINEFFTRKNKRIFQRRQMKEFEKINDKIFNRKNGKKKELASKSLKTNKTTPRKPTGNRPETDRKPTTHARKPEPEPYIKKDNNKLLSKKSNQGELLTLEESDEYQPTKQGQFIPNTWRCSAELARGIAECTKISADEIRSEQEKFIDYWKSASGANARKRDWNATFRNWCRKYADVSGFSRTGQARGPSQGAVQQTQAFEKVATGLQDLGAPGVDVFGD
jgi:uncharacterized protein YdaU (DUF1376 family)